MAIVDDTPHWATKPCRSSRSASGFSLVEILISIGIAGLLLALLLPALSSSREAARRTECQNRMRQISLATISFEASKQRLPPGTLGFDEAYRFEGNRYSPDSPFYWRRAQYTSWLLLICPYLEHEELYKTYPGIGVSENRLLAEYVDQEGRPVYSWFGEIPSFGSLASTRVSLYRCPSDSFEDRNGLQIVSGGLQPVLWGEPPESRLSWLDLMDEPSGEFAITNYVGCLGKHSGGFVKGDSKHNSWAGMMTSRKGRRLKHVLDGLSHTILFGESLGEIRNGNRELAQSWLVGGLGRGSDANPLGNGKEATWTGFSSAHNAVPLALADGHVTIVESSIDRALFAGMCGISEGSLSTKE